MLCLLLAGCGTASDAPPLAAVKGVVTYQQKPLASAQVMFTPATGPVAIGQTNEQGEFTLTTQGKNGAVLGEHRVTITAYKTGNSQQNVEPENDNQVTEVVSLIPAEYGHLDKSGLNATVGKEATKNQFQFDLK